MNTNQTNEIDPAAGEMTLPCQPQQDAPASAGPKARKRGPQSASPDAALAAKADVASAAPAPTGDGAGHRRSAKARHPGRAAVLEKNTVVSQSAKAARPASTDTSARSAGKAGANGRRQTAAPSKTSTAEPKAGKAIGTGRDGSKIDLVLKKLRLAKGATIAQLIEVTGWQAHSVRGFLSAVVRKKLGLDLTSDTGQDGVRRYRIAEGGAR